MRKRAKALPFLVGDITLFIQAKIMHGHGKNGPLTINYLVPTNQIKRKPYNNISIDLYHSKKISEL